MKPLWQDQRCVVCVQRAPLTEEHLIPEAIGGKLTCDFLCKSCNDKLGEIEAHLKGDPAVRLAIENLRHCLPRLWQKMVEGQPYVVTSKRGTEKPKFRKGAVRVDASRLDDDSLIQPTEDAANSIRTMLRREGRTEVQIDQAVGNLDAAPEDARVSIADGIDVVKWTVHKVEPALTGKLLDPLVPLKIAYEYLTLSFGISVLNRRLDSVRDALVSRGQVPSDCRVEELRSQKYLPFHGLVVERAQPHTSVLIRLFGFLAYRVHFLTLAHPNQRCVAYTLCLDSGEETLQPVNWSELQ
jgi:hypothetical protein